jgi:response regulator RpfG family c-di-GMP phosphodiesterase
VIAEWKVLVAALGGARCEDLVAAMSREGWSVVVAGDLQEAAQLAASGSCHMAVIACRDPKELSPEPVRTLMSLQADMAVAFLVPDLGAAACCLALAWVTAEQIHPLGEAPEILIEALRGEMKEVAADTTRYEVFCVDDDEDFLASLKGFLPGRLQAACPRFALDFEFFANPTEALAEAEAMPPDHLAVVVADQIMPQMEGIELLKRVKAACLHTSCVLLTGHASLDSAVTAINSRVLERYFFKPLEDPADFIRGIEHLLREHHLLLQGAAQRRRLMDQFELIRTLSAVGSEAEALAIAAGFLREQLGAEQVLGALLAEDGYAVQASVGLEKAAPVGATLASCELLESAARTGRLKIVNDRERRKEEARGQAQRAPAGDALAAFSLPVDAPLAVLPLSWGGRALGVILAGGRPASRPFTRQERFLLGLVRDVVSVAVGGWRDRRALEDNYVGMMATLMETIEAKDVYTRGHTERVSQLAAELAQAVGIGGEELKDLRRAATLHDIGKIAVPDAIILKPGRLDAAEVRVIQEHPARADKILRPLKCLDAARMIVRSHHERYDGKGYPDGLTAEEIPRGARILAVADAYDAMTSTRTYRQAMDPPDALAEIERGAGRQFAPDLVVTFVKMMRDKLPQPAGALAPVRATPGKESL